MADTIPLCALKSVKYFVVLTGLCGSKKRGEKVSKPVDVRLVAIDSALAKGFRWTSSLLCLDEHVLGNVNEFRVPPFRADTFPHFVEYSGRMK
jgi:hypothetical protein